MSAERTPPLVSIVVPCYRHKKFIRKALDSAFRQTWHRLQLIVIDDSSNDGTLEEAALWATENDAEHRFEAISFSANLKNIGAHNTINKGCALSRGDFIAILNSDDEFHPARIEKLVAAAQDSNSAFLFSRVAPIDENSKLISPVKLPKQLLGAFERADRALANKAEFSDAFTECNIAISTGNFMFSKELFQQVGPFADLKYVHDWDFALRTTLFTRPAYVPEDLYLYRIHGSNSFAALEDIADIESIIVAERYAAQKKHLLRKGM